MYNGVLPCWLRSRWLCRQNRWRRRYLLQSERHRPHRRSNMTRNHRWRNFRWKLWKQWWAGRCGSIHVNIAWLQGDGTGRVGRWQCSAWQNRLACSSTRRRCRWRTWWRRHKRWLCCLLQSRGGDKTNIIATANSLLSSGNLQIGR